MSRTIILFGVAGLLTACGLNFGPKSEKHDNQQVDLTNVKFVRFNGDDGDVSVSPATGTTGSVEFDKRTSRFFAGTGDCHGSQHLDATTLVIDVKKDTNAGCEVETNIVVPAAAQIDIKSDNGDIHVNHMTGIVNATDSNGDMNVTLDAPGGDAPALNASFTTDNGSLDVKVSYKPAAGNLTLTTDNGSAKVGLPDGAAYSLDSKIDNGSLKKDLGDTANASFKVSLKTSNGSLKVYKN